MKRAIGIVRVSQVAGREGESFASPVDQKERITKACEREGMTLVDVHDELDVSGGTPLARRTGMREAVEAIEAGDADVIVAAYFDRLFRSLNVQEEILRRVEAAGGEVLALDTGKVSNGSAGEWLNATIRGMMAEYMRRTTKERAAGAQQRAIDRGVIPWPNIPAGYVKGEDGRLVVDDKTAEAVARAFEMRAEGATVATVRSHLQEHGVRLSYHGTQALLSSRVVLGEINFGGYTPNLSAHPPIVDPEVWARVQKVVVPRGVRGASDRLLARLSVLRCASCGSRMIAGTQTQNGRRYPFYRCGRVREDCSQRVAISAELVEGIVVERVREAIADIEGRASAETKARDAELALERAQQTLDALIVVLDPLEPAAVARLREATEGRDKAREHVERLSGSRKALRIPIAREWDRLTFDEQRSFIKATVDRVDVSKIGRGADRIAVHLVE